MTPKLAASLTIAFQRGQEAARSGNGLAERFQFQGKQREFFENGYWKEAKKMEEELRAYYDSPEYRKQCEEDQKLWGLLDAALTSLELGDLQAATRQMNKMLGV